MIGQESTQRSTIYLVQLLSHLTGLITSLIMNEDFLDQVNCRGIKKKLGRRLKVGSELLLLLYITDTASTKGSRAEQCKSLVINKNYNSSSSTSGGSCSI